jgi:hypothetical protein
MVTKNLKIVLLLFAIFTQIDFIHSQCYYHDESNAPEELFRKRVKEQGMRYGNPYTMFVRDDNFDLKKKLDEIRTNINNYKIINKEFLIYSYADLFKGIYISAIAAEPDRCPGLQEEQTCLHPAWVKNNAIVYLLELKYDTTEQGKDTLKPMTLSDKNWFFDRANQGLRNLNPNVQFCNWGASYGCKKVRNKAIQLVYYLQAYDLLKTGGGIAAYDGDRNHSDGDCSPRNKLRQFARNIYSESNSIINSTSGWKKNHGIICASALGMAAIVLNDAGVETNYFIGLFDWVRPSPKYSPVNWYRRSHGTEGGEDNILGIIEWGEDGMEDNFFIGDHGYGFDDVPMTSPDGTAGYAEGTSYFNDLASVFFPYIRSASNFLPINNGKNYLAQQKYKNILEWYVKVQNSDQTLPSYDNSKINKGNLIGILGGEYKSFANYIPNGAVDLRGDYIFAMGEGKVDKPEKYYYNENSGNIILRSGTQNSENTFHMLAEKGYAIDPQSGNSELHEDDDMGSFMIYACNKDESIIPLAIDPPYTDWEPEHGNNTNKYWMHNTIEIDDSKEAISRKYENPQYKLINDGKFSNIQEFKLTFQYRSTLTDPPIIATGWEMLSRNVKAINNSENFYYIINDFINVEFLENNNFSEVKYNLNGNGNKDVDDNYTSPILKSYRKEGNIHRWTYPCFNNNWSLTAHISILNNNTAGKQSWESNENNDASNLVNEHITRLQIHQPTKKTIFQSFLYPQKCNWPLPTVTKEETADHVLTKIEFINGIDTSIEAKFVGKNMPPNPNKTINDTVSHIHFTRWDGNIADSVTNPFNLPSQTTYKLKLDAQKAFIINHTYGESSYGYKYCPVSSTNIKHASFSNGTYLKFKDSIIISSTKAIDASISFSGRQMYLCSIKPLVTPNSADTVKFHLADVGRGVEMLALRTGSQDTIPSRYDSLTNTINIALPTEETTFYVQEKFNCINCYFPPNWKGIDTTFEIEDGVKHTLGHKLAIKQPAGLLKLTNSSKLDFCSGVYVNSLDSIIIEGPCQTKAFSRKSCKGIDSMVAAYNDNSSITITSGSALVLGAGSYTHVKNGGAIYVKRNGSLIVKAGAFLQIGDSGTCNSGWGEIVAEPGAYIHIEPDAHIEYRRTAGDTVDRNLFLIPTQAGLDKANEGVYFVIKSILQTDNILPDTSLPFFTYPICGLDTTCPIVNKEWGYTSFGKPMAVFQAKNDTLCPGEPLHIKLNRIVNDARYQIKVCRMDSLLIRNAQTGINTWIDTCIMETIVQDSILPDPVCKEPHNTPEDWTYYFNPGTLHRVTVSVWNDCELFDDTTAYIYTTTQPDVEIDIPSTACEGIGTFTANLVDYHPTPVTYAIEVTEKPDTNSIKLSKGILAKTYTQSYYGLLPSTIGFGDYFFKGGRTYLVSLTISNPCGTISVYDSITIPLGVSITLERPTAYAQIVSGATSVKLKGFITEADSFHWEPTYWLDSITSLTPISTPLDSVTYILVAKKGTCTATDTAHIKYNRYANAGYADTLCFDSTHSTETLIGFPYDMSLFLGMLYYYDNTQFMRYYDMYNTGNLANYFRYFTHFMHDQSFENANTPCPINLFQMFTSTLNKEMFFKKYWFKTFYQSFTSFSNSSLLALDDFKNTVTSDTPLKDHLDSLNNWGNIDPCIDNLFTQYNDYLNLHVNEITTTWSRITDGDTSTLTNWVNFFVAVDAPTKSSKYILSVIAPSVAEIDEITILVDTILTPLFAPAMQFDSTVYLMNYTEPNSKATHYEWNFGDGSANSFETHPIHTFPAFDSNYVVCLIASNFCSSFTYCDTVRIDSLHLGGVLYTKKQIAFYETNQTNEPVSKQATSKPINLLIAQPITLYNYPNPFNNSTIIDYEIWQNYTNAELRITNVLGQTLFTQKLNKPIDKIQVDGATLSNGIYYYSIIVDGTVSQTKNMSVIH